VPFALFAAIELQRAPSDEAIAAALTNFFHIFPGLKA
jgi:hypothetical protein